MCGWLICFFGVFLYSYIYFPFSFSPTVDLGTVLSLGFVFVKYLSLFVKRRVKEVFLPVGEVAAIALDVCGTSLQLPDFLNSWVFFIFCDLDVKDYV